MSSVSNGLYFLTLQLVSVMRVIYRKIRHALYLYIKRNVEKVWGARYTLGARYLSKNTVFFYFFRMCTFGLLDCILGDTSTECLQKLTPLLLAYYWKRPFENLRVEIPSGN